MSKSAKIWLALAIILVVVGTVTFAAVMTVLRWDFSRLGTTRLETNTYEIQEEFGDIAVNTSTADVVFAVSEDNTCRVVCCEEEKVKYSVSVRDGVLTVKVTDDTKWFDRINFTFRSPEITVYLPETEYGSLVITESTGDITIPKDFVFGSMDINLSTGRVECLASSSGRIRIETSTGDIDLRDLSAGELELTVTTGGVDLRSVSCEGNIGVRVSTGDAKLTDVTGKSIRSDGSTGDLTLKNVITEETLSVKRSTGDVRLEGCDAGELEIDTDTGSVTGSLLSPKIFIVRSDTGKTDVPETTSGGKCKITTDTGDVRITVGKE